MNTISLRRREFWDRLSVYSKSPQIWFRVLRSDFESYGLISRATVWFRVLRYRFRVLRSHFETYGLSSRPWYIFLDRRSRIRDRRSRFRDRRRHFETDGMISRFWPVWPPINVGSSDRNQRAITWSPQGHVDTIPQLASKHFLTDLRQCYCLNLFSIVYLEPNCTLSRSTK